MLNEIKMQSRNAIRVIAIYLRVSTEDQAREGFSIENQRNENIRFIQSRFGNKVKIIEYIDIQSGYSTNRSDYMRMIADAEKGLIDAIVVWRADRFSRNLIAALQDLTTLTVRLKVQVFSVIEGEINFNDFNSKQIAVTHLNSAETERSRIQERVMPGMKRGAQLGHYQGTSEPPWGFFYDKSAKLLKWVAKEVKMIQIIFKKVAAGESIHSVTRYLNSLKYRSRRGNFITTKLVSDVVKREIYKDGYYRWNGVISEKPIVEPVIDTATWEKAQKTVNSHRSYDKAKRKLSRRDDSPYVLQGALKCIRCKANLVGHSSRGIRYYTCSTYVSKTSAGCKGQWVNANEIEKQMYEFLKQIAMSRPVIELAKRLALGRIADRNPEVLFNIRQCEKQLRELDSRFDSLFDLFHTKAITKEQFEEKNQALLTQKQELKKNLAELQSNRKSLVGQQISHEQMFKFLEDFDNLYGRFDFKTKKTLFNGMFDHIHAVSLGRWKGVELRDFKLCDEVQYALDSKKWKTLNSIITSLEPSSFTSRPLAAR